MDDHIIDNNDIQDSQLSYPLTHAQRIFLMGACAAVTVAVAAATTTYLDGGLQDDEDDPEEIDAAMHTLAASFNRFTRVVERLLIAGMPTSRPSSVTRATHLVQAGKAEQGLSVKEKVTMIHVFVRDALAREAYLALEHDDVGRAEWIQGQLAITC